ncbi:MAG: iron-sulfur cluster assembly accessory protein [Balneolales bacterium]
MSSQTLIDQHTRNAVNLTERAAVQVNRIIKEENIPQEQYLRIGVKGGGCAGMSYALGFDHKSDQDEILVTQGIQVLVDKQHILYLSGIVVDFHDGLDARGFVFENPNASSTCGCGTSFSA